MQLDVKTGIRQLSLDALERRLSAGQNRDVISSAFALTGSDTKLNIAGHERNLAREALRDLLAAQINLPTSCLLNEVLNGVAGAARERWDDTQGKNNCNGCTKASFRANHHYSPDFLDLWLS